MRNSYFGPKNILIGWKNQENDNKKGKMKKSKRESNILKKLYNSLN